MMIRAILTNLLLICALCGAASAQVFDAAKLQSLTPLQVFRLTTDRYRLLALSQGTRKEAGQAAVAKLDPQVRTLVWLAVLDANVSDATGHPVFYATNVDADPQIIDALGAAGMSRRAALFRTAAQIAKPYGVSGAASVPDMREIELGADFGGKAALDEAILAYMRNHPLVTAWSEVARARLSDEERVEALLETLAEMPDSAKSATLATWPSPCRTLRLVSIYASELSNGGLLQYFSNTSGDLALATVPALRELGLERHAGIVQSAIGLFPKPYATDRRRRLQALTGAGAEARKALAHRLDTLTNEAAMDDTAQPAMATYARRENILPR